ncbi:unnamed protein product, partial [Adineta steineri]
ETATIKAEIHWPCTWQCIPYIVCTHKDQIRTVMNSVSNMLGRKKRSACPPNPKGCNCNTIPPRKVPTF